MPVVERATVVRVAIDDAFHLSQSYGLRLEWDPFVRSQSLLGARSAAKGVRTLTRTRHGLRMISEYIAFRPPGTVAMKMIEGPRIFRLFSGAWHFKRIDETETEVVFKYHFSCRPAWLQGVMHPVVQRILRREIARRLDAFKRAAETPGMLDRLKAERAMSAGDGPGRALARGELLGSGPPPA